MAAGFPLSTVAASPLPAAGAAARGLAGPPVTAALTQPPPMPTLPGAAASDPMALRKAAQDFEAMAIAEMLRPMFDTIDTSQGMFGGGAGESAWRPMLVQEMAKNIAAHGGLGLSRAVYDSLLRQQEGKNR